MADEPAALGFSERRLLAVSALLVMSLPGAVWWVIGDSFDEPGGADYIFRLPEMHPATGGGLLLLVLASSCGLLTSQGSTKTTAATSQQMRPPRS